MFFHDNILIIKCPLTVEAEGDGCKIKKYAGRFPSPFLSVLFGDLCVFAGTKSRLLCGALENPLVTQEDCTNYHSFQIT